MKRIFSKFSAAIFIALLFGFAIQAQIKQMTNEKIISEITTLRQRLVAAIKQRDKKTLESLYAADFTHTHASGQVDDKSKRIAALLLGEPTIESAEVNEINIRVYGKTTAVAVGQSTVKNKDGSQAKYRWTTVYFKTKNNWQIVASQATKIAEK